jgi:hypothetical protein
MQWRSGHFKVVAGNNGYAGATGCEALSDFALVSGHGFFVPLMPQSPPRSNSLAPGKELM